MINKASFFALAAVFALAGCASQSESEPTSSSDNAIIGALTSPIGFADRHLVGTWEPVNAAHFQGDASNIVFTSDDVGRISFTEGESKGASWVTQNPLVWFFAGTYVEFRTADGHDHSLFVERDLDGEIELVDLDTWSWSLGHHTNKWHRTPPLTVNELEH